MDYSMEDTQNSAPGSVPAAKIAGARKGPDAQSVTKRYEYLVARRCRLIYDQTD